MASLTDQEKAGHAGFLPAVSASLTASRENADGGGEGKEEGRRHEEKGERRREASKSFPLLHSFEPPCVSAIVHRGLS